MTAGLAASRIYIFGGDRIVEKLVHVEAQLSIFRLERRVRLMSVQGASS